MWELCKCKYSIHLFNSVHICALWLCEALAGEMSVFLTFLALEPGCRTESWSVSHHLHTFGSKDTWDFGLCCFCPCLCGCPCWRFGLNGFLLDGFANANLHPYASLSSFALCLLGCLVFRLG